MSEMLTAKQAAEQLLYQPEYAADKNADGKAKAAAFAEGYKTFLNAAKTEREAAAASEKLLVEAGYEKIEPKKEYAPGQTIEVPVDIASSPRVVRSGAILPMSGNKLHNLMTEKTTALDILMAPDVDSEFTLSEDDGRTNDYRKGAYL